MKQSILVENLNDHGGYLHSWGNVSRNKLTVFAIAYLIQIKI